jgi:hypothetical protein
MKRTGKSSERKGMSHTQRPAQSSDKKKVKNTSYTQGDMLPNFEDVLMDISLKKPKRAYNFYINDMMTKEGINSMIEAVKTYSKKWPKLSSSEKKKYQDMEEEDKIRYEQHMELVKKHILDKPAAENATSYRLYLNDAVKRAVEEGEDPKEAKKEAAAKWNDMSADDKREWNLKKKDHEAMMDKLKETANMYTVSAYMIFCRDQMAAAREKDSTMTLKECGEKWKKTKQSIRDQYAQFAEEENEERQKNRDLYELAYGVKPKRPQGAYNMFLMEMAKHGKLTSIRDGPKLWANCSDEDKERYARIAKKLQLAYLVKKMEYQSSIRKNNPTRAPSAYNLYMKDMKGTVDTKNLPAGGFFQHCYKKWTKLDDAVKSKYIKQSNELKAEVAQQREEMKSRIYDMPSKPSSAFNIYVGETVKALKSKHPKKETSELFKMATESWKDTTEKLKAEYQKKADREAEDHERQVSEFEEHGYYTQKTQANSERKGRKRQSSKSQSREASQSKGDKRAKKAKN